MKLQDKKKKENKPEKGPQKDSHLNQYGKKNEGREKRSQPKK